MNNLIAVPHQQNRLVVLEAFRGICALLVVALHGFGPRQSNLLVEAHLAVDVFLVLSGFILAMKYELKLQQGAISFHQFVALRLIRLWPLVILGTALGAVVSWFLGDRTAVAIATGVATGILIFPNFLQEFRGSIFPLNFPLWSLFFELLASIAFGLAFFRMRSSALMCLCIASAVVILIYAKWTGTAIGYGFKWSNFWMGFPRMTLAFVCGVIVFRMFSSLNISTTNLVVRNLDFYAIFALLFALMMVSSHGKGNSSYELFAVVFVFPMTICLGAWSEPPEMRARIYALFGLISFPIYVLHLPIIKLIRDFSPKFFVVKTLRDGMELGVFFACLIVLSYLVGKYFDLPVRRWLKRKIMGAESAKRLVAPS